MKISAELCTAAALQPGDLFSYRGPEYWDTMSPGSVGEKVYIRTDTECPPDQREQPVFLITIQLSHDTAPRT